MDSLHGVKFPLQLPLLNDLFLELVSRSGRKRKMPARLLDTNAADEQHEMVKRRKSAEEEVEEEEEEGQEIKEEKPIDAGIKQSRVRKLIVNRNLQIFSKSKVEAQSNQIK